MKNYDKLCICLACPSYVECKDKTFCLGKKSDCIKKERGCLCGGCPVQLELKFKHYYYCTKDSEKKQEKHN